MLAAGLHSPTRKAVAVRDIEESRLEAYSGTGTSRHGGVATALGAQVGEAVPEQRGLQTPTCSHCNVV